METLHNEGRSLRYIANYLGFSKTTIFNELHRLNRITNWFKSIGI
nr:helix-turn-helix domain-containing protein [Limosilactobacillus reuteri]